MSSFPSPQAAFRKAVELAGGQIAFAKLVGRTQGNISQMLSAEKLMPGEWVFSVEEATGISRHDSRPDLYPRDEEGAPARASSLGEVRP